MARTGFDNCAARALRSRWPSAILLASALQACAAVGPDYIRPAANLPQKYDAVALARQQSRAASQTLQSILPDPVLHRFAALAIAGNQELEAAKARIDQARAVARQRGLDLAPTGNAAGSVSREKPSREISDSPDLADGSPYTVYAGELSASWELDFFGSRRRAKGAALADLQAAEADAAATKLTLVGDVAGNYVRLRAAEERLKLTKDSIRINQELPAAVEARFEAGDATATDRARSLAQLGEYRASLPAIEGDIADYTHQIALLLGIDVDSVRTELGTGSRIPAVAAVPRTGLPSDLLRRRPDVVSAERSAAAASEQIGQSIAEFFPKFSIGGTIGLQSRDISTFLSGNATYYSAGPSLQWRLLDFARIDAEVDQAKGQYRERVAQYRYAILGAISDVNVALARLAASAAETRLRRTVLQARTTVRDGALMQYKVGQIDTTDVLNTEIDMFTAQANVVTSRENEALYAISLYKSLGGDWTAPADIEKNTVFYGGPSQL